MVYFLGDDTVTGRLRQPEPGYRHEHVGPSILVYLDASDLYTGPIAIYCPLWQTINDLTHAIEIWRVQGRDQAARPATVWM